MRSSYPKWANENRIAVSQELVDNIINDRNNSLNKGLDLIAQNLDRINQLSQNKLNDFYQAENLDHKENLNKIISNSNNSNLSNFTQITNRHEETNENNKSNRFDNNVTSMILSDKSLSFNEPTHSHQHKNLIPKSISSQVSNRKPDETISLRDTDQDGDKEAGFKRNSEDSNQKNQTVRQLIASTLPARSDQNNRNEEIQSSTAHLNFAGLGTTGNILIKEYEQEIKRQDSNIEFTATSNTLGALINASLTKVSLDEVHQQSNDVIFKNVQNGSSKSHSNYNSPILEEPEQSFESYKEVSYRKDDSAKNK